MRYIIDTLDYNLQYERCPGMTHLIGNCDNDLIGDIDTSKNTSGVLFFLGNYPVNWQSFK
jgi:hypothetical protein